MYKIAKLGIQQGLRSECSLIPWQRTSQENERFALEQFCMNLYCDRRYTWSGTPEKV